MTDIIATVTPVSIKSFWAVALVFYSKSKPLSQLFELRRPKQICCFTHWPMLSEQMEATYEQTKTAVITEVIFLQVIYVH